MEVLRLFKKRKSSTWILSQTCVCHLIWLNPAQLLFEDYFYFFSLCNKNMGFHLCLCIYFKIRLQRKCYFSTFRYCLPLLIMVDNPVYYTSAKNASLWLVNFTCVFLIQTCRIHCLLNDIYQYIDTWLCLQSLPMTIMQNIFIAD